MEKQIFDNITDYIFSTQALVDRINRMFTIKLQNNTIDNSITHLIKRVERVEQEETFLLCNPNMKLLDINIKIALSNYMGAVNVLLDIIEVRKGYTIDYAIEQVEKYEDLLLQELKRNVKQQELDKFINDWLPVFKHTKLPSLMINEFRKECKEKGYKVIEILTEMVKRAPRETNLA